MKNVRVMAAMHRAKRTPTRIGFVFDAGSVI
jgi:hypothetical protein